MYYYYNETGDIVSMSPIKIDVKNANEIFLEDDINPSEYQIVNNKLVKRNQVISVTEKIDTIKPLDENIVFLNQTDYKVIRHRDQLDLGIETSMTNEEYLNLLQQRQNARNSIKEAK